MKLNSTDLREIIPQTTPAVQILPQPDDSKSFHKTMKILLDFSHEPLIRSPHQYAEGLS